LKASGCRVLNAPLTLLRAGARQSQTAPRLRRSHFFGPSGDT